MILNELRRHQRALPSEVENRRKAAALATLTIRVLGAHGEAGQLI